MATIIIQGLASGLYVTQGYSASQDAMILGSRSLAGEMVTSATLSGSKVSTVALSGSKALTITLSGDVQ